MSEPSPLLRLALFLLAATGAILASSPLVLGAGWIGIAVPLAILTGTAIAHARFLVIVVTPIAVMLFVVWGWLIGAPPGAGHDSDRIAGILFAATTSLRLVVLGAAAQLFLLTIPRSQLTSTLRAWGLRGDLLLAGLATFVFFPELRVRADQILTARMARGLVPDLRLTTRIRQIAPSLGLLFTLAVRAAVNRADHWAEQHLFDDEDTVVSEHPIEYKVGAVSAILIGLVAIWLVACIVSRVC